MSLTIGARLGPYDIVALIGAGGMGEVYRARDSRLDRTVAIKVLPSHVATDPTLKQRFEREARAVAALNHPHICTLHDVGQQDGIDYLVMEYLEGQTLAERLVKGPLPLDQALRYAIEIADALDKAHRQGITHRDLKPGNVMLTRSGGPSGPPITKLLDFGLAKSSAPPIAGASLSMLPTVPPSLTAQGTILGTLQYMAPEQLEGKDADARTDIFAFGTVVYEMVTGRKAFEGTSQASLIGAIMTAEPAPLSTLQPMTPGTLDHAVRTCMAKNPEDRWQSARDLWTELRWIAASPSVPEREEARSRRIPIREIVAWTVTAVAIVAGLTLFRAAPTQAPSESVMRFSLLPPSKGEFRPNDGPGTLSPDGRQIVFAAPDPTGVTYLWLRTLDSVDSKLLSGTEEGYDPFWSPDGRQVAFAKESELYKINISTGALDKICDLPDGRGGTWNRDGAIVFTPDARGPLFRVPASGGTPTPITTLDGSRQETGHWRPQFLPGGQRFIYLALSSRPENSGIYAGSLDSTEVERVADLDVAASYAPPGYLLYVRQGNLMAQPFDAEELRVTGEPMIVARDALYSAPWGAASFSTSDTGILSYQANLRPTRLLFWFDRSGRQLGSVGEHVTSWGGPRISPDGRHAAWRRDDPESRAASIWISDLARGVGTRFTRDATIIENNPVWSPDGSRIAFLSTRGGPATFYARSASGGGDDELLLKLPAWGSYPQDWSPDGKVLLYSRYDAKTRYDLWTLPIMGDRAPKPLLQTRFQEDQGRFSPDGRWIAYVTDESGKAEVWVQSFPSSGSKRQISDGGGTAPAWRGDGREIFYMHPDGKLMSVEVRTDGTLESGVPKTLFSVVGSTGFAATRDGNRFLVSMSDPSVDPWPITIVVNWAAGLTP